MPGPLPTPSRVLNWDILSGIARSNAARYRTAKPFPHAVFDGLFSDGLLDRAIAELPGSIAQWKDYNNANEVKQVCSDAASFGPAAETLVHTLNSAPFVKFLEDLTGIQGLIPDPHLHAAGYMKVSPGGHLGLHYDFATQRELRLERRINVLLYLNRDWKPEWGGQLELHSSDGPWGADHHQVDVEPLFNRVAIFNTPNALHGHRRPIACPPGRARLCLSWYYYTAIPVLGWATYDRAVAFPGRFDLERSLTVAANMLVPPILFKGLQAIRSQATTMMRRLRARRLPTAPATTHQFLGDAKPAAVEPPAPVAAADLQPWQHPSLLDFASDVIIIWEMDGAGIQYWNQAAESLYGYTRDEALGKTTHDLLKTRLSGSVSRMETELARFGIWVGKLRHRTRDGREVHVEGRLAILSKTNGKWLVIEVNRDVTDQVAAESAGRAMERQLQELQSQRGVHGEKP